MSNYIDTINSLLKPRKNHGTKVLDLFAGAGGLALGFEAQGFETIGYEMEKDYCDTYSHNLNGTCYQVVIDLNTKFPKADVIIGGPPCQPFSVRGKQNGASDDRNGFPEFIQAVRQLKPKIFLVENVRGLLYRNHSYLKDIINSFEELGYKVDYRLFHIVHYGVPQTRQRVVIVGHKGGYSFPHQSKVKVTAGEALGSLATHVPKDAKFLTPSMEKYIANYEKRSACITPRDLHLDKPARTLTCRNLAGATSDMHRIKLSNGRRRRITVREAARLQSFPDSFEFKGSERSAFYQIGNAVPPFFAFQLAKTIKDYLKIEKCKPPHILDNISLQSQSALTK